MVRIDQVVVGIGKEGGSLPRAGPLAGRICERRELRINLARRPESGIVKHVEILAYGTGRRLNIDPPIKVRCF